MTDSEERREVQGLRLERPGVVIAVQLLTSHGTSLGRRQVPALKRPRVEGSGAEEGLDERALTAPWRQEGQRAGRSNTRGHCRFEAVSCSVKAKALSWAG